MKLKRIIGGVAAGTLAASALVVTGGSADATIGDVDPLFSCTGTGSGADIGDAKIAPGITTVNGKLTIKATFTMSSCGADEGDLDEIAAGIGAKFGVKKTSTDPKKPRPAVASATAKAKFFGYGDCLGIVIPDPDDTGEYPATHGKILIDWLDAGGGKVMKSQVFATLDATATAGLAGIVIKGAGVGGTYASVSGFAPAPGDDFNKSGVSDFVECALLGDPTAKGRLLDVLDTDGAGGPATLTIEV